MTYDHIQHTENEFELREVSIFEVLKLVDKLSKRKASGLDNIPIRLLKASALTTIGTLTYILNLVICSGIIPADWKSFIELLFIRKTAKWILIIIGPYLFYL